MWTYIIIGTLALPPFVIGGSWLVAQIFTWIADLNPEVRSKVWWAAIILVLSLFGAFLGHTVWLPGL